MNDIFKKYNLIYGLMKKDEEISIDDSFSLASQSTFNKKTIIKIDYQWGQGNDSLIRSVFLPSDFQINSIIAKNDSGGSVYPQCSIDTLLESIVDFKFGTDASAKTTFGINCGKAKFYETGYVANGPESFKQIEIGEINILNPDGWYSDGEFLFDINAVQDNTGKWWLEYSVKIRANESPSTEWQQMEVLKTNTKCWVQTNQAASRGTWGPYDYYFPGDIVTFQNKNYKCLLCVTEIAPAPNSYYDISKYFNTFYIYFGEIEPTATEKKLTIFSQGCYIKKINPSSNKTYAANLKYVNEKLRTVLINTSNSSDYINVAVYNPYNHSNGYAYYSYHEYDSSDPSTLKLNSTINIKLRESQEINYDIKIPYMLIDNSGRIISFKNGTNKLEINEEGVKINNFAYNNSFFVEKNNGDNTMSRNQIIIGSDLIFNTINSENSRILKISSAVVRGSNVINLKLFLSYVG